MKIHIPRSSGREEARALPAVLALAFLLALIPSALAFPPGPDALIYGMVKDQYGTPLNSGSQVILQTPSGVQVPGRIQPGLAVGINYMVSVPMDSGLLPGAYTANAQVPANLYKLYVVIGTKTNLPIEMAGDYASMGIPASQTLQNLTVGVDSNGNGIPDAWELAFLAQLGTNMSLGLIDLNGDYAQNGRTLRQEYLLGNYPFNPGDNFKLEMVRQEGGTAMIGFTTMTGRGYQVLGSTDLQNWTPLTFTVLGVDASERSTYTAPGIHAIQIQTIAPTNGPVMQRFFRMTIQ